MNKLDINSRIFVELATSPPNWWKNLVSEKGVYIDIRKDNYIDIYFNGGSIIRELKHNGKKYTGSIHYKYLLDEKSEYIEYSFDKPQILAGKKIDLLEFKDFGTNTLKRIKANISQHYPAKSEKGIQARFVSNSNSFIDTEFAYKLNEIEIRIDLVWIDTTNSKIVFVELKTMGDSRLYTDDIYIQLKKYSDFAHKYENDIIPYYQKLFEIKKSLNILPKGLNKLPSLNSFSLEKKPLLLFGDCSQDYIDKNAPGIDARLDNVAIGAYYFGGTKYNCDIIPQKKGNRHIF